MRFGFVRNVAIAGLLSLLLLGPLAAQTGTITGVVRAADTEGPLIAAVVQVLTADGGRVGSSLSNQSGRYQINVPAGTYVVTATTTGYATGRFEGVQVTAGQTTTTSFDLSPRAFDLDPVVVSASRREERALDAPARVEVVSSQQIADRPAVQPTEHLRGIAGIDIVSQGLQSTNVVARGFNNVFSGALLALTDHRIAAIPSLRVNALYMVPATNDDIERMEVVLGPGSALYGPNTANGVLHMFTRSPLTHQGTSVALTGGERSVFQGTARTSHLLSDDFGVKFSGEYFRGDEWEFDDPVEVQARQLALQANPNTLVGLRDFGTERWSVDGRLDWRISPDATAILSLGRSTTVNAVELTGIGGSQVRNWSYDYLQTRFNWNRLFAQAYANFSSAGDTYRLRDGAPTTDDSRFYVGQIQHGFQPVNWQNFTYGFDYLRTEPFTGGTIHGRFEDEDMQVEAGAFLQSETALNRRFDLVLAGRVDRHSVVAANVFSPRAALVFKPTEAQTLRASYNRAYSNPGSVNLFLDLGAGPVPGAAGQLGYTVRAMGTGRDGFSFRTADGEYRMRTPFVTTGESPGDLRQITVAELWERQLRGLARALVAQGQFDAGTAALFVQFMLPQAPLTMGISGINTVTGQTGPFVPPEDIPGIRESNVTTYEVGYKGILGGRILVAADVWYAQRDNFVSALMPQAPFVQLNPDEVAPYAQPRIFGLLLAAGYPPDQAQTLSNDLANGLASIPGGVVAAPGIDTDAADLLISYRNFGDINLWGTDLSATALIGPWTLGVSTSMVSDDHFRTEGQVITLNAPKRKGSVSAGYRDEARGFNGEARLRHHGGFPVNSGVFIGLQCIQPESLTEPCVESHTLADLTLGYRVPQLRGATVQLSVQNVFDTGYRSFVGVPEIGRMALLRLKYDF
jgi:outer membrane receptor for ferrienterochelin and colicins